MIHQITLNTEEDRMKVLIIENELLAQKELERLLLKCESTIEILGYLESIEESVAWLSENHEVDLIFMDIQLSDGLSFEIFNKISLSTPVIFTTAYDEYAINAFKVNSIDYLLKPIEQNDLQTSLNKYQDFKKQFSKTFSSFNKEQIEQLLNFQKKEYKTRFVSLVGDRIQYINVEDIAYFYADDKIVFLVTHEQKEFIIDHTLENLETLLDPKQFFRLNRTYVAQITSIDTISKYFKGRLKVSLIPQAREEIVISRERSVKFKEWLDR